MHYGGDALADVVQYVSRTGCSEPLRWTSSSTCRISRDRTSESVVYRSISGSSIYIRRCSRMPTLKSASICSKRSIVGQFSLNQSFLVFVCISASGIFCNFCCRSILFSIEKRYDERLPAKGCLYLCLLYVRHMSFRCPMNWKTLNESPKNVSPDPPIERSGFWMTLPVMSYFWA